MNTTINDLLQLWEEYQKDYNGEFAGNGSGTWKVSSVDDFFRWLRDVRSKEV